MFKRKCILCKTEFDWWINEKYCCKECKDTAKRKSKREWARRNKLLCVIKCE